MVVLELLVARGKCSAGWIWIDVFIISSWQFRIQSPGQGLIFLLTTFLLLGELTPTTFLFVLCPEYVQDHFKFCLLF